MLDIFQLKDGKFTVVLTESESNALREVFGQVTALINHGSPRDDPAMKRLFPDGYRDNPKAANELRRLTEGSLRTTKVTNAREILATLPGGVKNPVRAEVRLTGDQAESWLAAMTDARLVLAQRLEITDETDLESLLDQAVAHDAASQDAFAISVYQYLSFLQESLVEALAEAS